MLSISRIKETQAIWSFYLCQKVSLRWQCVLITMLWILRKGVDTSNAFDGGLNVDIQLDLFHEEDDVYLAIDRLSLVAGEMSFGSFDGVQCIFDQSSRTS